MESLLGPQSILSSFLYAMFEEGDPSFLTRSLQAWPPGRVGRGWFTRSLAITVRVLLPWKASCSLPGVCPPLLYLLRGLCRHLSLSIRQSFSVVTFELLQQDARLDVEPHAAPKQRRLSQVQRPVLLRPPAGREAAWPCSGGAGLAGPGAETT